MLSPGHTVVGFEDTPGTRVPGYVAGCTTKTGHVPVGTNLVPKISEYPSRDSEYWPKIRLTRVPGYPGTPGYPSTPPGTRVEPFMLIETNYKQSDHGGGPNFQK
eukprot:2543253-Rhodomonas_salina.1